ncbi:hypothetical protein PV08_11756 [Exophiala spinifera]|uniref:NmrA-like domain-containing protein n=1 Tax=Exophiala spinifera TaxID=91928 RepID=A0A0D2AU45_9EURO|nr:uncharacterized protein PV08_11756 [Exophiala spinifera]KIW09980.1 hypothetical protein PV08_11756 [Exophiala spinifera]
MSSKLIVVIGATGTQGGSVVETFLRQPGWRVRGLTRNTGSPASQILASKGVEVVAVNLDDVSSLVSAFKGADAIFSVTDFWTGFRNPPQSRSRSRSQTLMDWAHDYELQQGKNVFAAADQTEGLERLVFSALSYATKWSKGKYTHVYHYDSEARAVEYARTTYPDLMNKKTSIIQIGMYLSNMTWMPHYQPRKNAEGVYVLKTRIPPTAKIPLIATDEDTGPLTLALLSVDAGKHLLAFRELTTLAEFVAIWGRVNCVETRYETTAPDEVWIDIPELREDIEDAADYIAEFGFDGGDPSVVHPKDLGVPINLPSVADWVKKQDWSGIL